MLSNYSCLSSQKEHLEFHGGTVHVGDLWPRARCCLRLVAGCGSARGCRCSFGNACRQNSQVRQESSRMVNCLLDSRVSCGLISQGCIT